MRSTLALAGILAGAATFLAPLTPASAVCQQPLIILGDGGGGDPQCAGCPEAELYEDLHAKFEKLPPNPFMCVQ